MFSPLVKWVITETTVAVTSEPVVLDVARRLGTLKGDGNSTKEGFKKILGMWVNGGVADSPRRCFGRTCLSYSVHGFYRDV